MAKYLYSPTKQRVVLLLAAGLVLGFSHSPRVHAKIWKGLPKAWKTIGRATLRRIIKEFKYKQLIDFKENSDGTITVVLTKLGHHHALRYDPDNLNISKPLRWDRKWRVVVFDIPQKKKRAREALRFELKKLGFIALQKSVWVFPYSCQGPVDFLVEFFEIRDCVRLLEVSKINHDADLRLHFDLA